MKPLLAALGCAALSGVAFADVSGPAAAAPPPATVSAPAPAPPPTPACGGPGWGRMRDAVAAYCATDAAPSEARGCRVVLRSFDGCARRLSVSAELGLSANVRDPGNESYAWMLNFTRRGSKLALDSFRYAYDDCDCC